MNELNQIPSYQKGMPYKPIYETDFLDELTVNWGEEWGIKSAFGKIRKIMVYRPGEEQKDPLIAKDYQLFNLPEGPTDLSNLQKQHDNLVTILKSEGIDIDPYIKWILTCEESGYKTIYLLAFKMNIIAAKKIEKFLDMMSDRFEKVSESNFNVKINSKVLPAICIRYYILKNL